MTDITYSVEYGVGQTGPAPWDFNLSATAYVALTTYAQRDAVVYDGSFWVSLVDSNTGNTPGDDATKWVKVAQGISDNLSADVAAAQAVAASYADVILVSEYIPAAQMTLIRNHDFANQDAALVGAGIQSAMDAAISIVEDANTAGDPFAIVFRFPRGVMATDREIFSETFAQMLWDEGASMSANSRFVFDGDGTSIACSGWTTHKAVRTSGFWAQNSITDAVHKALFRWEMPTKKGVGPVINGLELVGEEATTDPIGYKIRAANLAQFNHLQARNFRAPGIFLESINNSAFRECKAMSSGWQPMLANTSGVMPSTVTFSTTAGSGTTAVAATEDVFSSDDVGKWFAVEDAGAEDNTFFAQISVYTDARNVTLDAQCANNVTGAAGSFTMLTGTIGADTDSLVLGQEITTDLIGRYVTVYGAGSKVYTEHDTITTRVIGQVGAALQLATDVQFTVHDAPVIVHSDFYLGFTDDYVTSLGAAIGGNNNQLLFTGLQIEHSSDADSGGSVGMVMQRVFRSQFVGTKVHGQISSTTNFGGNGATRIFDNCKFVQDVAGMDEWGGYEPSMGAVNICGEEARIVFKMLGFGGNPTPDRISHFYIDPRSGSDEDDFTVSVDGHFNTPPTKWGQANQSLFGYGTNGTAAMVSTVDGIYQKNAGLVPDMPPMRARGLELIGATNLVPDIKQNGTSIFVGKTAITAALYFGSDDITTLGGTIAAQNSWIRRQGDRVDVHVDITLSAKGTATGSAFIYLPSEYIAQDASGGILQATFVDNMSGLNILPSGRPGSPKWRYALQQIGGAGTGMSSLSNSNFEDDTQIILEGYFHLDNS